MNVFRNNTATSRFVHLAVAHPVSRRSLNAEREVHPCRVSVGFMVKKMTLWQVSFSVLRFSRVSIIPLMFRIHLFIIGCIYRVAQKSLDTICNTLIEIYWPNTCSCLLFEMVKYLPSRPTHCLKSFVPETLEKEKMTKLSYVRPLWF